MTKPMHKQNGFTLVEMAIVLLIMGLIVGAIFSFLAVQQEEKAQNVTRERQEKIAQALASFAQRNGRLPCPSKAANALLNNYGEEIGCAGHGASTRVGIVPFKTLGLEERDIVDGYGNPYTYSPDIQAASTLTVNVHQNCRTSTSWIPAATNQNPAKARFCCQEAMDPSSLEVYSRARTDRVAVTQNSNHPTGLFNAVNTPEPAGSIPDTLTYFAYVLVSHGKDGAGSFTLCQPGATAANCNNTRKAITATRAAEVENADDQQDFITLPRNTAPGNDHFDDIVLWRTQERVISEFGNDSCAVP